MDRAKIMQGRVERYLKAAQFEAIYTSIIFSEGVFSSLSLFIIYEYYCFRMQMKNYLFYRYIPLGVFYLFAFSKWVKLSSNS